jgi:selenocysteine lyase/cysteine desulfurase
MRKVGFRKITDRTRELHEYLVTGLLALGAELLTPIRGKTWSALVFCRLPGMNGTRLARLLGEKKIFVTSRVFKNFDGIRISPYFYNTEEDIDRLLGELKRIKSR